MGFALSAIWGNPYVWRKPENLWRALCLKLRILYDHNLYFAYGYCGWVLLLSEDGGALLNSIWVLLAIAGLGFIAFYLIVGGIAFFKTDSFKWFYNNIFPWIVLGLMILYWIYWLLKNLRNIASKIKRSWVERRGYSIFVILLLFVIVFSVVVSIFIAK